MARGEIERPCARLYADAVAPSGRGGKAASVRRDGRIQAQGSPADYARLGVVEERLDRAAGPGSIAGAGPPVPAVRAGRGAAHAGADDGTGGELVRDAAHAAAPARKGRRAAITSIRRGTAAAGLPAAALAPSDVPGTSPTGTGTAPATPKPGRHSRSHTATSRPGLPKPSRTSAARPPDQGKPASPYPLRKERPAGSRTRPHRRDTPTGAWTPSGCQPAVRCG